MVFSRSKKYSFPPEFTIDGSELLSEIKEATILGVKVSSSLCWEAQVQHMVAKASRTVWTLRRMKVLDIEHLVMLEVYMKEIRSVLELAVQA